MLPTPLPCLQSEGHGVDSRSSYLGWPIPPVSSMRPRPGQPLSGHRKQHVSLAAAVLLLVSDPW